MTDDELPRDLKTMLRLRLTLLERVHELTARIDSHKIKCTRCDAMVLPGQPCPRCDEDVTAPMAGFERDFDRSLLRDTVPNVVSDRFVRDEE